MIVESTEVLKPSLFMIFTELRSSQLNLSTLLSLRQINKTALTNDVD